MNLADLETLSKKWDKKFGNNKKKQIYKHLQNGDLKINIWNQQLKKKTIFQKNILEVHIIIVDANQNLAKFQINEVVPTSHEKSCNFWQAKYCLCFS